MKKISIHRTSNKKGAKKFTTISNGIVQDEHMTFDEAMLLTYLLSLPKDFIVIKKNIYSKSKNRISKERFRVAWINLVEKGYIVKVPYTVKNMKRIRWEVFENPEDRDSQNRDSREPSLLISKQEESKEVKSNNIESNTIINNTGPSILEENVEMKPKSQFEVMKDIHDEAAAFLYDATSIGEEIFNYSKPSQYPALKSIIGEQEFKKIEDQLRRYNNAASHLGWN